MVSYISESISKGTAGAYTSVGLFALIGLMAVIGLLYGLKRGLPRSLIRLATVVASIAVAFTVSQSISKTVINAFGDSGISNGYDLVEKYAPDMLSSFSPAITDVLSEIDADTLCIFVMMLVSIVIIPIVFIVAFYIVKAIMYLFYRLLAGLTGAVEFNKGITSTLLGGLIGAIQGVLITGVIMVPISGICGVVSDSKDTLISTDESGAVAVIYDNFIDDLADNPVFNFVDAMGGKYLYESMTTVTIDGEEMNMRKESQTMLKFCADLIPLTDPSFQWENPTEEQRAAFGNVVDNVGYNELMASLTSDVMRGLAKSVRSGRTNLPFDGTNKILMDDVMKVFETSNKDNIEGDLRTVVNVYYIMCDKGLLSAFNESNEEVLREMLTEKDELGNTVIDDILNELKANDRTKPIVRTFTKISLSLMHESMGLSGDTEQLYEESKDDIKAVISHSREDFETEEEYKAQVSTDLEQALQNNNLTVDDEVKQNMVDYIAENYGDKSADEITDDDIDDAILSYYSAYADHQNNSDSPDSSDTP